MPTDIFDEVEKEERKKPARDIFDEVEEEEFAQRRARPFELHGESAGLPSLSERAARVGRSPVIEDLFPGSEIADAIERYRVGKAADDAARYGAVGGPQRREARQPYEQAAEPGMRAFMEEPEQPLVRMLTAPGAQLGPEERVERLHPGEIAALAQESARQPRPQARADMLASAHRVSRFGTPPARTPRQPTYEEEFQRIAEEESQRTAPIRGRKPALRFEEAVDYEQSPTLYGAAEALSGLTTPETALVLGGAGLARGVLQRLVGGAFTADMANALYEQNQAFQEAVDRGDEPEARRIMGQAMVTGAMLGLVGTHTVRGRARSRFQAREETPRMDARQEAVERARFVADQEAALAEMDATRQPVTPAPEGPPAVPAPLDRAAVATTGTPYAELDAAGKRAVREIVSRRRVAGLEEEAAARPEKSTFGLEAPKRDIFDEVAREEQVVITRVLPNPVDVIRERITKNWGAPEGLFAEYTGEGLRGFLELPETVSIRQLVEAGFVERSETGLWRFTNEITSTYKFIGRQPKLQGTRGREEQGALPGMEAARRGMEAAGERARITERVERPPEDVTAKAGLIERESPLFRESGASGQMTIRQAAERAEAPKQDIFDVVAEERPAAPSAKPQEGQIWDQLAREKYGKPYAQLGPAERHTVFDELQGRIPKKEPKRDTRPVKDRYPPDIIEQAENEMQGATGLLTSLPETGRIWQFMDRGGFTPGEGSFAKEMEIPLGSYGGMRGERPYSIYTPSQRQQTVGSQYPWYYSEKVTPKVLEKALAHMRGEEVPGGRAAYNTAVREIAESILKDREAARPIMEEFGARARELAEQVREIDTVLADELLYIAEGRITGRSLRSLRQLVERTMENAEAAARFSQAFNELAEAEAKSLPKGAAEGRRTDTGARAELGEEAPGELGPGTFYANPLFTLSELYQRNVGRPLWKTATTFLKKISPEWLKRASIPRYGQPEAYQEAARARKLTVSAGVEKAELLGERLVKDLTLEEQQALGRMLKGELTEADVRTLRSDERWFDAIEATKMAREELDSLGGAAVLQGLLKEETFFKNYGKYLPRLYRKWEVDYDAMLSQYAEKRPTRMDLDRFRKRKDIPDEIRALMGEILEPGYPVAKGIAQLTHDVETMKLFNTVAGNEAWTKSEPTPGFVKMPATAKLGPLSGKYVERSIADELNEVVRVRPEWERLGRAMVSEWKFGKVVLAPATHGRNMMSNALLSYLGGGPTPLRVDIYGKALFELHRKGPLYQQVKKLGMVERSDYTTAELGELLDTWNRSEGSLLRRLNKMREAIKAGEPTEAFNQLRLSKTKVGQKAARLYQAEEHWFKLAKVMHNLEKGMKLEAAVADAQKWLIDYSDVPKYVDWARKSPLGAPFLTFTYKALPLVAESMVVTPWRMATILYAIHFLGDVAADKLGLSEEQRRDIEKVKPERMKGQFLGTPKFMLLPWKDRYGQLQFLDLTYILPWGDIGEQGALGRDIPVIQAFGGLSRQMPLLGSPFVQVMAEIGLNKSSFTERPIYNPWDSQAEVMHKVSMHLWRQMAPSMAPGGYGFERWRKALLREEDFFGRVSSVGTTAASTLAGLKTSPFDVKKERRFRKSERDRQVRDIDFAIGSIRRNKGLSVGEKHARIRALREKQRKIKEQYREILQ